MATARLAAIDEGKEESGESDHEETNLRAKSTDSNTLTTAEDLLKMSDSNLRKLRNAYRHPFEYISPLLYRKSSLEDDKVLKAT
jgi:hypothetical protein